MKKYDRGNKSTAGTGDPECIFMFAALHVSMQLFTQFLGLNTSTKAGDWCYANVMQPRPGHDHTSAGQ